MNIPDRLYTAVLLGKHLRHGVTCVCGKGCFQSTLYRTFGYVFRNNSQTFFDKHTKSIKCKEIIKKHAIDFGGTLSDKEVMALCKISRNSYYKYKREIKTQTT